MKLKQLINGGALAATVLTLGSAQAEPNPNDGVVFCRAKIVSSGGTPYDTVSITLPFTGDQDYTYWNLGAVPAGGVVDSWHGQGGPGRFEAHNNGEVGAYVYLTSRASSDEYEKDWHGRLTDVAYVLNKPVFDGTCLIEPTPSLHYWRNSDDAQRYCLAFTRDMEGKIPTWRMLDMWTVGSNLSMNDNESVNWQQGDRWEGQMCCVGAYMGYLEAGEYMPFDVKFWAPHYSSGDAFENNVRFTFMVEAAPFPLWEHDSDVQ